MRKRAYDPQRRRAYNLARYGLTEDQFQRMLERQHGLCDLCAKPLPPKAHVDHVHARKESLRRVRGILCWPCNRMLGNGRNTPALFRRAADYLEAKFDGRRL